MKKSTEKVVVVGILVAGAVALFTASAAAARSGTVVPSDFHPELSDEERLFIYGELQARAPADIMARSAEYENTTLPSGKNLSPAALSALAAETVKRMSRGEVLSHAP